MLVSKVKCGRTPVSHSGFSGLCCDTLPEVTLHLQRFCSIIDSLLSLESIRTNLFLVFMMLIFYSSRIVSKAVTRET